MTLSQSNEHLRVSLHGAKTSSRSLNIDPTRDLLNFEITQGCQVVPVDKRTSIPKRIRENLKKKHLQEPHSSAKVGKPRDNGGKKSPYIKRPVADLLEVLFRNFYLIYLFFLSRWYWFDRNR